MKKVFLMIIISCIVSVSSLFYVNNYVLYSSNTGNNTTELKLSNEKKEGNNLDIPSNFSYLIFNDSGKKAAYISDGIAYITDLNSQKNTIKEDYFVSYIKFLNDKNILYSIYENNTLIVKEYNISKNISYNIAKFNVKSLNKVINIWVTNKKVILEYNYLSDGDMNTKFIVFKDGQYLSFKPSGMFEKAVMVNSELVYNNTDGEIYINGSHFEYKNLKFSIIGEINNILYLCDKDDNKKVYAIDLSYNSKVNNVMSVNDNTYNDILCSDSIYFVYNNIILDLVNNKKIDIDENSNILFINKNVYAYEKNGSYYINNR